MKKVLELNLIALMTLILCSRTFAGRDERKRHWTNGVAALVIAGVAFWYAGDEHFKDEIDQNFHLADMAAAMGRPEDAQFFRDKAEKAQKERTLAYIIGGISGLYATLELSRATAKKPKLAESEELVLPVTVKFDRQKVKIVYNFKF